MGEEKKGLELLRKPFPENQINKLPKGSKAQMQCKREDKRSCNICGGFHHPKCIHLDYVGHAALTDRLLDADPLWYWEPLAFTEEGLPAFDASGGLWIKLHVCGHARIGYGNAEPSDYKEVGAREKEVIGDALRNAAMRFGAALDLWHKGDLHIDDDQPETKPKANQKRTNMPEYMGEDVPTTFGGERSKADLLKDELDDLGSLDEVNDWEAKNQGRIIELKGKDLIHFMKYKASVKKTWEP